MGLSLVDHYRKIRLSIKTAFFATIIIGLFVHLYKFSNTFLNHDSLFNFYSTQNSVGSGRWFLTVACFPSTLFDLPWVNGLLSLFYAALTMAVITELFHIENPFVIILSSGLLITFPGITETFFFSFTADGYMLAMLLAALGVYLSRIDIYTPPTKSVLSAVCICLSCGIYQAYVPFALVLAVCHLVFELMENQYSLNHVFRWIVRQILVFASAMAIYYLIWKLCMHLQGISANDYKGISEVAQMQFNSPLQALLSSFQVIALFFLQWNVFEHGFTTYGVLNILFLLLFGTVAIAAIANSKLHQRKVHLFLLLLCVVFLIPFICIWSFATDDLSYRPMMLVSIALLYIFTAILADRWIHMKFSNLAGLLLSIIVFHNALIANISYNYMNQCSQKTFSESIELMTQIRELQFEYEIDDIAILGNRSDEVQLISGAHSPAGDSPAASSFIISSGLEKSLLYDDVHTLLYLEFVHGLSLPSASSEKLAELKQSDTVQKMENWPSIGSLQVVNSTLVIKYSDIESPN